MPQGFTTQEYIKYRDELYSKGQSITDGAGSVNTGLIYVLRNRDSQEELKSLVDPEAIQTNIKNAAEKISRDYISNSVVKNLSDTGSSISYSSGSATQPAVNPNPIKDDKIDLITLIPIALALLA